jgi:hypothetical protein
MPPRQIPMSYAAGDAYAEPTPAVPGVSPPVVANIGDSAPTGPSIDAMSCGCGGGCDAGFGCNRFGCGRRFGNCGCGRCRGTSLFADAFGGLEYLIWYNKGIQLPPLVTTSPNGTPQATAGVLPPVGNATVLFGNNEIDDDRQSGARLTFGMWTDACHNLGIGAKLYGVDGGATRFNQTAAGNPILARPFFDADPIVNQENALLISFPGVATGTINISAANDILGSEVFIRSLLDQGSCYRIDLIAGWQYNRIDSDLSINSEHVAGATTFRFNDQFDAENEYNAGTIGLYTEIYRNGLTFSAAGKIGIGAMHQEVLINGTNSVTVGGATVTTAGGFLTQPTNIGTFDQDVLTWSPEVNFRMSYAVSPGISLSLGYTFLYWTQVAFAGDQVDRVINSTQLNGGALVGPARPTFLFRDTDFWVQSLDLGLTLNY